MSSFIIGINGGGTRTSLVAVDPTDSALNVLARIETGPSNVYSTGVEAVQATLKSAMTDLIVQAGGTPSDLRGIGAAISGVDRPGEHEMFTRIFAAIYPGVPLALDNDAVAALIAGAGRPHGVVVICGTGSITYGLNGNRRARADGWGYLLDQASGYRIGCETLLAISRAYDGTALPTALTDRVLARLGLNAPSDLIAWMYAPERQIKQIAALATEVVALENMDVTATGIIVRAADALALNAITVARQLKFGAAPFPIVLSGGLFKHSTLLRARFTAAVRAVLPKADPAASEHDAAVGAAMMIMQSASPLSTNRQELFTQHDSPALNSERGQGGEVNTPRRPTEQRNPLTLDIAQRPTLDLVRLMNLEDSRIARQIAPELPKIAALIDAIAERFSRGGRILMAGAGTSGRLAVLDAIECRPTFGVSPEQVIGILAGGVGAMMGAVEGAEDSEADGHAQIVGLNVNANDSVIGIAASGSTPFVQGILREAAARGALTASVTNVPDAPISALAQHPIVVAVGAEVIMGSTRLRAGTAQKLVLNMITTGVMVRAGRTFGNLMTDMQASNIKLRGRARVIVAEATGLSLVAAGELLDRSDGEIKTAVAAALLNLEPDVARERLNAAYQNLNRLTEF